MIHKFTSENSDVLFDSQVLISFCMLYLFFWLSHTYRKINMAKSKTIFYPKISTPPLCSLCFSQLARCPSPKPGNHVSRPALSHPSFLIHQQSLHFTSKCLKPAQFPLSPCHFSNSGQHRFAFGLLEDPPLPSLPSFNQISL